MKKKLLFTSLLLLIFLVAQNTVAKIKLSNYNDGTIPKSTNFIDKTTSENSELFNKVEDTVIYLDTKLDIKPEFPGGIETFNAHVNIFLKKSINKKDSTVFMIFIVEKNGELSNIKIIRGIDSQADEQTDMEIIEIVKNSPKWKPGEKEGQKVRCVMPFILTINGSK
jgi:hypothetical protein